MALANGKIIKFKSLILFSFLLTSFIFLNILILPVKACHCVGTYESDYNTPKVIFMQGEIVYGKVDWIPAKNVKLRNDPNLDGLSY